MIIRYPSVAALARDAETKSAYYNGADAMASWCGGETAADSVRLSQSGDVRLVPKAQALLSQITTEIGLPETAMVADVAGGYPCVPDYLAGMPDCMRRRATVETETAPIAIYACLSSYAAVSADTLLRRGVAVLALTMALSQSRPVELWVLDINAGPAGDPECTIAARINTQPLDLATAAYAFTSAGFVRRLMYGLTERASGSVDFPVGYSRDPAGYLSGALARLGGDPDRDLILPPASNGDPLISDPVAWVNAQVARLSGEVA